MTCKEQHSLELLSETNVTVNTSALENTDLRRHIRNDEGLNLPRVLRKFLRIRNQYSRLFLAEAFGTFLMMAFGLSSVAQQFFTPDSGKNSLFIVLAFGFGVMIAILVTGKACGAHLNTAVSFAQFLTGRMSLAKLGLYTLAQLVGAFLASVSVYGVHFDSFTHVGVMHKPMQMASIFVTAPNAGVDIGSLNLFFDQIFSTALLIVILLAIGDSKNEKLTHEGASIVIGFIVMAIGLAFGHNCGYPINPARDLAPRIFAWIVWGPVVFTHDSFYFWIPIVGPMVGSFLGVLIYSLIISNHWPSN